MLVALKALEAAKVAETKNAGGPEAVNVPTAAIVAEAETCGDGADTASDPVPEKDTAAAKAGLMAAVKVPVPARFVLAVICGAPDVTESAPVPTSAADAVTRGVPDVTKSVPVPAIVALTSSAGMFASPKLPVPANTAAPAADVPDVVAEALKLLMPGKAIDTKNAGGPVAVNVPRPAKAVSAGMVGTAVTVNTPTAAIVAEAETRGDGADTASDPVPEKDATAVRADTTAAEKELVPASDADAGIFGAPNVAPNPPAPEKVAAPASGATAKPMMKAA